MKTRSPGWRLVILLVVGILIISYLGYGELSHSKIHAPGTQQKPKQGMLSNDVVATSNLITDPGGMVGYPAVDGHDRWFPGTVQVTESPGAGSL